MPNHKINVLTALNYSQICSSQLADSCMFKATGMVLNLLSYLFACCQILEALTVRQTEMQLFLADGCKEALLEEKRRFCFLVDKHCLLTYQFASYHDKVKCTIQSL